MVLAALAVAVGLLPLALVGPAVFSDGSAEERNMVIGMIVPTYGLLGAALGSYARSWKVGLWLAVPGFLVAVFLSDVLMLTLAVCAAVLLPAVAGAYGGMWLRMRMRG